MRHTYGKPFDPFRIGRSLSKIRGTMEASADVAARFAPTLSAYGDVPYCRVCGCRESHPFAVMHDVYEYRECDACGSLFLSKLPDVSKMYSNQDALNDGSYIDESVWMNRVDMIARPKVDFICDAMRDAGKPVKDSLWVDIGAGGGEALYSARERGFVVRAIESDPNECAFLKKKGIALISAFVDPDHPNVEIEAAVAEAAVVSLFNVAEHLTFPRAYFSYLTKRMKQGSFLVVEVPRHPALATLANITSQNHVYRHLSPPGHLQLFSEKGLAACVGDAFEPLASWEFGQGFIDLVIDAMVLAGREEDAFYRDIIGMGNEMQKVVDERHFADQMLVVMRKA